MNIYENNPRLGLIWHSLTWRCANTVKELNRAFAQPIVNWVTGLEQASLRVHQTASARNNRDGPLFCDHNQSSNETREESWDGSDKKMVVAVGIEPTTSRM
jgi:hypothetical protein